MTDSGVATSCISPASPVMLRLTLGHLSSPIGYLGRPLCRVLGI